MHSWTIVDILKGFDIVEKIGKLYQAGETLIRYDSYVYENNSFSPYGDWHEYDVFSNQEEILSDFIKLVSDLQLEWESFRKMGALKYSHLKKRTHEQIQGDLLNEFIQKHGLFGIANERKLHDLPNMTRFLKQHDSDAFPSVITVPKQKERLKNYLGEWADDDLPGEPVDYEEYESHFPLSRAVIGSMELIDHGETVKQIINNPMYIALHEHIIQEKKKHIELREGDGTPSDFIVKGIESMGFVGGTLTFSCKSLLEAISVMYTLNLNNQNGNKIKLCKKKGCNTVFTAISKSDPALEKQYCSIKCKEAAVKARQRKKRASLKRN